MSSSSPGDVIPAAPSQDMPLGKNRAFHILLAGESISCIGDGISLIALPLLVLETTGSIVQMGMFSTITGIGAVIGGILAGAAADSLDRRRLLLFCDVARVLLHVLIPCVWWSGLESVWLLYVVGLLSGGLGSCFMITLLAALPGLVARSQLTAANGYLTAGYGLALFVGPLLGGVLCVAIGTPAAIGVDGLTFAVSALALVVIRLRPVSADGADIEQGNRMARGALIGFRFIWREPTLRAVVILGTGTFLLIAAGRDLFIFHLKENLGQGDDAVGAMFGLAGIGALVGGLLSSRVRRLVGFGPGFLGAVLAQGLSVMFMGQATSLVTFMIAGFFFACANSVSRTYAMTIRQELTPDRLLGRVTSAFWLIGIVSGPPGIAGAALLAEHIGVPKVLALLGGVAVLLSCVGLFTPVARRAPSRTASELERPVAEQAQALEIDVEHQHAGHEEQDPRP